MLRERGIVVGRPATSPLEPLPTPPPRNVPPPQSGDPAIAPGPTAGVINHPHIGTSVRPTSSRELGTITSAEAARRYVIDGQPYFLRGQEQLDGGVVAELAEAIECLIQDELPPVPVADRHWFFGVEGGPRTL